MTAKLTATVEHPVAPGPFHVSVQVTAQAVGVVRERFGSYSQVIAPAAFLRMYLYWMAVLCGSTTVARHTPSVGVSGTALVGAQLANAGWLPTTWIASPVPTGAVTVVPLE